MTTPPTLKARPLSPHLQIYKPQLTSGMSILHRLTGVALSAGLVIFVIWLVALASGPDAYATFISRAQSFLGQLTLFGIALSFFYHLCCGIRHLVWDTGKGLEIHDVYKSGYIALTVALLLTLALWLSVYGGSL